MVMSIIGFIFGIVGLLGALLWHPTTVMCIIWILIESPDLAITEAAVGAGISGTLFLMTLRKIHAVDRERKAEEEQS